MELEIKFAWMFIGVIYVIIFSYPLVFLDEKYNGKRLIVNILFVLMIFAPLLLGVVIKLLRIG